MHFSTLFNPSSIGEKIKSSSQQVERPLEFFYGESAQMHAIRFLKREAAAPFG